MALMAVFLGSGLSYPEDFDLLVRKATLAATLFAAWSGLADFWRSLASLSSLIMSLTQLLKSFLL